jgi:hypothetical protein
MTKLTVVFRNFAKAPKPRTLRQEMKFTPKGKGTDVLGQMRDSLLLHQSCVANTERAPVARRVTLSDCTTGRQRCEAH